MESVNITNNSKIENGNKLSMGTIIDGSNIE